MKKIIVLDTEGMSSHNPYNIGYVVADRNGNIYLERNFAYLPAIIENVIDCEPAKELVIRGASEILETEKYFYVRDKQEILNTLRNDIIDNKVSDIWAYNCPVYRYLFDENNFIEEHTALEDSKIELSILLKAFKTKKKLVWDCRQPWRILKEKYDKERG